jgi:hypothetical protein
MKRYTIFLLALSILACNKGLRPILPAVGYSDARLAQTSEMLKDSLSKTSFDSLDFSHAQILSFDTGTTYYIRIPSIGFDISKKFILIRTGKAYQPTAAARLVIAEDSIAKDAVPVSLGFYGSITKTFLNGTVAFHSAVNGGYIQALHSSQRVTYVMAADEEPIELPEIVIYAPDDGDDGEGEYYDLISIIGGGGGSVGGGYAASGGGGGGSAAGSSSSFTAVNLLLATTPGIDLQRYFNCFDNVPSDANTTYTASLLVKVPNTSNPSVMWDPTQADGVGHTFIELTKTNGTTSITQYIGFYGQGGVLYSTEAALGFSVPSKLVDNSSHLYNAKLSINLSGDQFSQLLNDLQSYSMAKYNLSSYNCTTYGLSAFNNVLPTPLNPPAMAIPGQAVGDTPNGLFITMESMPANGPDGQVSISSAPQTAGSGHGPCN